MLKVFAYTLTNGDIRPGIVVKEGEESSECVIFLASGDDAIYDIGGYYGKSPRLFVPNEVCFPAEIIEDDELEDDEDGDNGE